MTTCGYIRLCKNPLRTGSRKINQREPWYTAASAIMIPFTALSLITLPLALATPVKEGRSLGLSARSANATLPIYRNDTYCVDDRVEDLLSRMTLEEKAGQMFHTLLRIGPDYTLDPGSYDANAPSKWNSTENMVGDKLMTHFNLVPSVDDPRRVAEWFNLLQRRALDTRLGIPITLSTDPRHSASGTHGASVIHGAFSEWPETLGLSATRDPDLVRKFAEVAREEYLAVGIRASLGPQVDLATEPRWSRIFNTWSEDADLTAELISEYIKGFQGPELGPRSVSTVTKHFPGGGPMENGEDSHFTYGKNQTYPGNNMEYHLIPFKAAIGVGASQMMPYYSRPIGTEWEEVGFSFNKEIVTKLLREELGFDGIVATDWTLITDSEDNGFEFPARAWGMEDQSELERTYRIIEAGCDQFGGEERPELVVELVEAGRISEERINVSVRRLLKEKFILGLFDSPFVDPESATRVVGNPYFYRLGQEAQRRSYTLLKNEEDVLPLRNLASTTKIYAEGLNSTLLVDRGFAVVKEPEDADLALLRLPPPFSPRDGTLSTYMGFQAGTLEYSDDEKARQAAIYGAVPSIVDIYFDRPVAVPEVAEQATALVANYGANDGAFLDVVFGDAEPEGKLPFDILRSDKAAEEQMEDMPFDTKDPVYKFGHGLRYKGLCDGKTGKRCGL